MTHLGHLSLLDWLVETDGYMVRPFGIESESSHGGGTTEVKHFQTVLLGGKNSTNITISIGSTLTEANAIQTLLESLLLMLKSGLLLEILNRQITAIKCDTISRLSAYHIAFLEFSSFEIL